MVSKEPPALPNVLSVSGPEQRALVALRRASGAVISWGSSIGWIQPLKPVDHPCFGRFGGKIFFAAEDVQEPISAEGAAVTFFVYVDANGLGAMDVRPEKAPQPVVAQLPATTAIDPARYEKSIPDLDHNGRHKRRRDAERMDPEAVLERVHNVLYNEVWQAAQPVAQSDPDWSSHELTKRVVKYFFKAAQAPELLTLPWDHSAQQLVDNSMRSYSTACSDKPWFFELDLAPALCAAAWQLVQARKPRPRIGSKELEQLVVAQYEDIMDRILLEKAMWDSTAATFSEVALCAKVYKAVHQAHEQAFNMAASDLRHMEDIKRVELFMNHWLEGTVTKAWKAFESGSQLSQETVVQLFQRLIAPFGEGHPFSCVPPVLTQSIGRPPRTWPFLEQAVQSLEASWCMAPKGGVQQVHQPESSTCVGTDMKPVGLREDPRP